MNARMMTQKVVLLLLQVLACSLASVAAFVPITTTSNIPVHSTTVATGFSTSTTFSSPRVHPQQKFAIRDPSLRLFQSSSSNSGGAGPQSLIEIQEEAYLQLPTITASTHNSNSNNHNHQPDVVYIILYHPGSQEEGVHTVKTEDSRPEVMLAFESLDEINKFANLLRNEPTFHLDPIPTPAPLANMEVACRQMGLVMKVVPAT